MATLENTIFQLRIDNMVVYTDKDSYQNLVKTVFWSMTGNYTDETDQVFTACASFSSDVNTDNIEDFTPYEQLTQDIVVGWISETTNIDDVKTSFVNNINDQINPQPPSVIALPPPF